MQRCLGAVPFLHPAAAAEHASMVAAFPRNLSVAVDSPRLSPGPARAPKQMLVLGKTWKVGEVRVDVTVDGMVADNTDNTVTSKAGPGAVPIARTERWFHKIVCGRLN